MANEANEDVNRLTKKYGLQPHIIPLPQKPGAPSGMIAYWGDVVLEPIDANTSNQLAAGNDVRAGLMIDHIGNFRRSAQLGLPVYHLLGGAGYVWAASWDQNGRGTLRFLAIDASTYLRPVASAPSDVATSSPAEKTEAEKAAENIAAEKAASDRAAAEQAAADRAAAERAAAEKAAADRLAAEKAAAEKAAADRAAAEKAAADAATRKAEIELARQNDLRQKGVEYAGLSETHWTIARKAKRNDGSNRHYGGVGPKE